MSYEQDGHNGCFLMGSLPTVCFQLGFLKGSLRAQVLGTYRRESQLGGPFGWLLVEDGAERGT